MEKYYRITSRIELPKDQRQEAGKANPYAGETFTYRATAEKLHRQMDRPDLYHVAECYRSSLL